MNNAIRLAVSLLCLAWVAGCGTRPPGGTVSAKQNAKGGSVVVVFAAASATNALDEIQATFSKGKDVEVRTSCAASSTLAQQIVNGAEADVFISADVKWADYVEAKVPVAKRRNLLGNRLVIVVASDSRLEVKKAEDLLSGEVKHLALADPDVVPAGKYAKQALTKLGLWDKVKAKVASADDVRHALTYVETGAAEAGIVYATDAAISKKVKVAAEISEELSGKIRYPLVLLKHGKDTPAAESFYKFLSSPPSLKVFRKYGFTTLAESESANKPK
jgi:molybdate transport system substrate-binding protein